VAANLEADWNDALRHLNCTQEDYERQREADALLDEEKRQRILALATDFPRLWPAAANPAICVHWGTPGAGRAGARQPTPVSAIEGEEGG